MFPSITQLHATENVLTLHPFPKEDTKTLSLGDIILFLAESYFLFGMLTAINMCYAAAAAAKSLQSCLTLCDPVDGSPPGSATPGILQARTLEWVAIPFMEVKSESEVAQSCPTPGDSMDCSLQGSSVHGIFQARVLEWGAIAFSEHVL